jgi:hypothetical protein
LCPTTQGVDHYGVLVGRLQGRVEQLEDHPPDLGVEVRSVPDAPRSSDRWDILRPVVSRGEEAVSNAPDEEESMDSAKAVDGKYLIG